MWIQHFYLYKVSFFLLHFLFINKEIFRSGSLDLITSKSCRIQCAKLYIFVPIHIYVDCFDEVWGSYVFIHIQFMAIPRLFCNYVSLESQHALCCTFINIFFPMKKLKLTFGLNIIASMQFLSLQNFNCTFSPQCFQN